MNAAAYASLASVIVALLGGQGLLMWRAEHRIKQSQAKQNEAQTDQIKAVTTHTNVDAAAMISATVLTLLAPLKDDLEKERLKLSEAVEYIFQIRSDMVSAGIPVRPVPPSLKNLLGN